MHESLRQLLVLAMRSKKVWIIPITLALSLVAILVIGAQIAPVSVFLYPMF